MENHTYPPPPPPPSPSAVLHHRLITKYLLLLPGQQAISRDAALLAGLAALHDLDEIVTRHVDARLDDWQKKYHDQAATISELENALDDAVRRLETHRDSAEFWRTQYDISQTQLSALEAECQKLKTQMNESSSPTTAQTALSEPVASNTSKPPAPTHPSQTASTTASAAPAAPASSATTTPPKPARPSKATHPLPSAESAAERNPLTDKAALHTDPTSPWLAAAREITEGEVENCIQALNTGQSQWRRCSRPMRLAILAELWQPEWEKQGQFDRQRPQWMPTAGALAFLSTNNRWSTLVRSIIELRVQLSATSC